MLQHTGCGVAASATLGQILAVQDENPAWLHEVERVIPLVDYLAARLTGQNLLTTSVGMSPLSSSGFLHPRTGQVDRDLLEILAIPQRWIPDPQPEMQYAGDLAGDVLDRGAAGVVVKVAGHDTATALKADDRGAPGRLCASLGSWAVVGVVVAPDQRHLAPFTKLTTVMHEATADGELRVNKDIPAMRLLQQIELELYGRAATAAEQEALFPSPQPWQSPPTRRSQDDRSDADHDVLDVFTLSATGSIIDQVRPGPIGPDALP